MKFLVEISDEEVGADLQAAICEITEAIDMETGFISINVTVVGEGCDA